MWWKSQKSNGNAVEYIIVGLGNPGLSYERTRHNAGMMALAVLAGRAGVKLDRAKFKSLTAQCTLCGVRVLLMAPQTYMNNSGEAVTEAMRFYKLPPERVVVLQDDISLAVGAVRVRRKGSDGGQKGLRSIITLSGSEAFPRVKIGVGAKPHPDYDLAKWVLSNFTKEEQPLMETACETAANAAECIVQGKIDEAMNRFSH